MVAESSALRLLTLLLVVQECPCLPREARLAFSRCRLQRSLAELSSPRRSWSRRGLLSLCFHGTLTIGPPANSSSMASPTVASTSSGEGSSPSFIPAPSSSVLNPLQNRPVTASRGLCCPIQADAGSPVSRVVALRVFLGTLRLISCSATLSVFGRHLSLAFCAQLAEDICIA